MALVDNQAALLIKDADSKEQLWSETFKLLADKQQLNSLSENIRTLAKPNAAKEIVDVILEVAGRSERCFPVRLNDEMETGGFFGIK